MNEILEFFKNNWWFIITTLISLGGWAAAMNVIKAYKKLYKTVHKAVADKNITVAETTAISESAIKAVESSVNMINIFWKAFGGKITKTRKKIEK